MVAYKMIDYQILETVFFRWMVFKNITVIAVNVTIQWGSGVVPWQG